MPDEDKHFSQAEKNERLSRAMSSSTSFGETLHDWEVTTFFYSALHYVDAYLATKGIHPSGHNDRDGYVAKLDELKAIYHNYTNLELRSRNARYDLIQFPRAAVTQFERQLFVPVKTHLRSLLSRP